MKSPITNLRFRQQFKSLNYYSMPTSILFIVRKRTNLLSALMLGATGFSDTEFLFIPFFYFN